MFIYQCSASVHFTGVYVVPHCHLDTKSPYLSGGLRDLLGLDLAIPMSLLDEDCVLLAGVGFALGGDVTFGISGITGKSSTVLSSSDVVEGGSTTGSGYATGSEVTDLVGDGTGLM